MKTLEHEFIYIDALLTEEQTDYGVFSACEISETNLRSGLNLKVAYARHPKRALAYALRELADKLIEESKNDD